MRKDKWKNKLHTLVDEIEVCELKTDFFQNISYVPLEESTAKRKMTILPKMVLSLIVLSMILFFVIKFSNHPFIPVQKPQEVVLTDVKKKIAYQTIGCYSLIESTTLQKFAVSTVDYDAIKREIENYIILAQNYLEMNKTEIKLYESDRSAYAYMYHIVTERDDIWFYFNETSEKQTDDIDEVSSKIEGILCMNQAEYFVRGEKVVEEGEIETTLAIVISSDQYIEVSQEIENRENEYEFVQYQNGKKTKKLEIEIKEEENCQKVSIQDKDYLDQVETEMEFEQFGNQIHCDIATENYEGHVVISIVNGVYEYIFEENKKIFFFYQ